MLIIFFKKHTWCGVILLISIITLTGLFWLEIHKCNDAVDVFFSSIQAGNIDKANSLLDGTLGVKIDPQYKTSDSNRLIKSYFSMITYKILLKPSMIWNFKLNKQKVTVELTTPDILAIMKTSLDEYTSDLFLRPKVASLQASNLFIKNIEDVTSPQTTVQTIITVVKKDGQYYLIPNEILIDELVKNPEKSTEVLDTLLGQNR